MKIFNIFFSALLAFSSTSIHANEADHTRTVESCNRQIHFTKVPERAVSHDINMTEMMLALDLQDKMVGYTGVEAGKDNQKILSQYTHNLSSLSRHAPNIETLLAHNADFLFAGWNYGLKVGGVLTPEKLAAFNIPVYELAESCIHIMKKKPGGFNDIYTDLNNLGVIFSEEDKATTLVNKIKSTLGKLPKAESDSARPKVFVFDSGFDTPFTSGLYGMPNAIIEAAGGKNIFADLEASWTTVNWEPVVQRNPEIIIIVDYGEVTAQEKMDFLVNEVALSSIEAIKNKRLIVLTYNEVTPSLQAVDATVKLHNVINVK